MTSHAHAKTGAFAPASGPLNVSQNLAQEKHRSDRVKYLAKSNMDFRAHSRREDAELIRRAFRAPTQSEISKKAARKLGISERQIINYMQMQNDMPSWAVKAVQAYLSKVERIAERIEGAE